MTAKPSPGPAAKTGITRPAIGVLVDPDKLIAARRSAMLERLELAHLSQALALRDIAAENEVDVGDELDQAELRRILTAAGVNLGKGGPYGPYTPKPIGVSRDEIAKLENRERKRPKITTLRLLIDALNYARVQRGKLPIDVEDLELAPPNGVPEQQAM